MKTTITAALALVLLASTASAALAQDQGGRGDGRRDRGGRSQDAPRDTERRDMTGGPDNRGQRRSEFQVDQAPAAPRAREAPQAPAAVQAPEARPRPQFRGDGGQGLANGRGRDAGPAPQVDDNRGRGGDRRFDGGRRGDGGQGFANGRGRDAGPPPQVDNNRDRGGDRRGDGARGGDRRWDGNRGDNRGDGVRDGRRDGERRGDGRNWDPGDRNRGGDRRDWDRRDDRGRPHWQQGRYPQVYRSQQRYRYGYYRPPIGFYSHSWGFGEYLPRGWYGSDYLLDSWWDYDLPYPPPGYDWVRVGSDALLIDSFTGRVVQVVRYIFW